MENSIIPEKFFKRGANYKPYVIMAHEV